MWGWYGELREWKTGENVVIWWQPQLDLSFSPWVPTWSDMKGGLFWFYVREELKIPVTAPLPLQIIDQTASFSCCCVEVVISGYLEPEIITWCMPGFFFLKHKKNVKNADSKSNHQSFNIGLSDIFSDVCEQRQTLVRHSSLVITNVPRFWTQMLSCDSWRGPYLSPGFPSGPLKSIRWTIITSPQPRSSPLNCNYRIN